MIETWNGTAWTMVPSPGVPSAINALDGVSCVSARACTAVGAFQHSQTVSKTLIESWNGTAWAIVPSPNRPSTRPFDQLNSISCVSARACTAVGFRGNKTLIESWNGAAWTIVPSPNGPDPRGVSSLSGVSCLSASACTAVGTATGQAGSINLIESWNGAAWAVVPSPSKGVPEAFDGLHSVSCVSVRACTAVGSFFSLVHHHGTTTVTPTKTLVESWDGADWTIVPSPNKVPGKPHGLSVNVLFGVSCASAATCTAVGNAGGNQRRQTLTELGTSGRPLRGRRVSRIAGAGWDYGPGRRTGTPRSASTWPPFQVTPTWR